MFIYKTTVRLQDTDATGVIYFSQMQKLCLEAFEEKLKQGGFSLRSLIDSPYLLPIVHAEADYLSALRVDEEILIYVSVSKRGTSSFTLQYELYKEKTMECAGKASIVHVAVFKEGFKSTPIPECLLKILEELSMQACAAPSCPT